MFCYKMPRRSNQRQPCKIIRTRRSSQRVSSSNKSKGRSSNKSKGRSLKSHKETSHSPKTSHPKVRRSSRLRKLHRKSLKHHYYFGHNAVTLSTMNAEQQNAFSALFPAADFSQNETIEQFVNNNVSQAYLAADVILKWIELVETNDSNASMTMLYDTKNVFDMFPPLQDHTVLAFAYEQLQNVLTQKESENISALETPPLI